MLRESRGAGAGSGRTSRRGFPAPVGTGRERSLAGRPSVCPRHPAVFLPLSPPPEGETGHQRTRLAAACSFHCRQGATCAVPDLRPPFRSLRRCLCVRLCFSVREENTSTSDLRVVPRVGFYASAAANHVNRACLGIGMAMLRTARPLRETPCDKEDASLRPCSH